MNAVYVPEEVYFGLYKKIGNLTEENRYLKHLNENQMNMIIDLRNEITNLKRQNGDLCELVGKTKKETKDYEAMRNELRSLQDENAARIEAYEKLDKRYGELSHEYSKALSENVACTIENYHLRRKLDNGCNTCADMENTKKKNDELRELIDFKRNQIENQADTIRDLDKKLAELRAGAKDLQEQNQILKDSIKQLRDDCSKKEEDIRYWKAKSNDYWLRRSVWKDKYDQLKKECDVPDNCVNASEAVLKDADAKINELKKNHEVAMNNQRETYRAELKRREDDIREYRKANCTLRKQLEDARYLYNALIKELARKGED